ncbi:uncharacterized protein LOC124952003 isoform X3 [Vespa velutina]|uniref:uncharacterized protein LOC124952003 isoform X3 n=1 Tax=Vespa velutina TaxID=202808 RepID=UPI001FB47840|nr:uncharacterized protein LOC124952003 isoform X3 [Vespa velutina]
MQNMYPRRGEEEGRERGIMLFFRQEDDDSEKLSQRRRSEARLASEKTDAPQSANLLRFNRKTTDGRSSCPIRSSPLKDIAGLHQRDEEDRRTVESFNERVAVYRTAEGCERIIWVNTKRAEQIRRNHEHVARREAGVEPAVHKEILRECDDAGGSTRKSRRSRGSSENSMYAYRSGHDVVRIHKQHIRAGPYSGVLAGHGYAAAIRIAGRTSTSK